MKMKAYTVCARAQASIFIYLFIYLLGHLNVLVNRTIRRSGLFNVQASEKITYNSAVFTEQSAYKTNYTHSIFRTIEACASQPQQIIKTDDSNIKEP